MILDDFSMGLDPGYRRLFVEYLKEYTSAENKTVFLTSHIIQDMEMLIDDCIILDYGSILLHRPTREILDTFHRFKFRTTRPPETLSNRRLWNTGQIGGMWETYSFLSRDEVEQELRAHGADPEDLSQERLSLEDAFIGLTGKY
jgi:ABC-2 type transport system ATP-binding protein